MTNESGSKKWETNRTSSDSVNLCSLCIRLAFCPEAFSFVPFCWRKLLRLIFRGRFGRIVLQSHHITTILKIRWLLTRSQSAARPLKPVYVHTRWHIIYNPLDGWWETDLSWLHLIVFVFLSLSLSHLVFFYLIPFLGHFTDPMAASWSALFISRCDMWVILISLWVNEINTLPHGKKWKISK